MLVERSYLPAAPTDAPISVASVAIVFEPPRSGCIDFSIMFGERTETFWASDVFDPFPDLLEWMRRVADGKTSCIVIDQEGDELSMVAEPQYGSGDVRLTAWADELVDDDFRRRLVFDVLVAASPLIASIYDALRDVWEKPDPAVFWRQWYCLDNKDAPSGVPVVSYEVRDEVIERFLGRRT